ncbi:Peroxidase [Bertholletia excelsa]
MASLRATALALIWVMMSLIGQSKAELSFGFYRGKCGSKDVEAIVRNVVFGWNDTTIAAALLRLQFHDCFVNGCDASILLDGTGSEKEAGPNRSVRGYEIIDAAKAALEMECPAGLVSCADIIVMATRDAVARSGGHLYAVQTGRRDGVESLASKVNLPAPSISVSDSIKAFAEKGLNATDMISSITFKLVSLRLVPFTLFWILTPFGHTVGVAHCSHFKDRLYNFQGTGKPDPDMAEDLLRKLRSTCPENAALDNTANLDRNPESAYVVDNSFYQQIVQRKGILRIDQAIAMDPETLDIVRTAASAPDFPSRFASAIVKLGAVEVLIGTQGQIRNSCRVVNVNGPVGLDKILS